MKIKQLVIFYISFLFISKPLIIASDLNTLYLLPEISTGYNIEKKSEESIGSTINNSLTLTFQISSEQIKKSGAKTVSQAIDALSIVDVYSQTSNNPLFTIHGLRAQVLLNGQPLSGFDSDASLINLIPIDSVKSIDIDTTSNNIDYDDGMLGGVINIKTSIKNTQISISPSYPKYGLAATSISKDINKNNKIGFIQSINDSYNDRQHDNNQSANSMLEYIHRFNNGSITTNILALSENSQFPGGLTKEQYNDNPNQASNGYEVYKSRSFNIQSNIDKYLSEFLNFNTKLQYRQLNAIGYFPEIGTSFKQDYQTFSFAPKINLRYFNDSMDKSLAFQTGFNYRYQTFINTSTINHAYRQSILSSNQLSEMLNKWQLTQALALGITYDHGSFIKYEGTKSTVSSPSNETYYPISGHIGISYHFNNFLESAIQLAHNYQLPFIDQSDLTPDIQSGFGLKPQTSNGITISQIIKNNQLRPIKLAFDFYLLWINNQIAYDPNIQTSNPYNGVNINLSPIFEYGFDFINSITMTRYLSLGSSINFNQATFRSGQMADNQPLYNKEVPGISNLKFEIHTKLKLLHRYLWYLQAQYKGSHYADGDFTNQDGKTPAYWLINTTINYQQLPWLISLRINNLFDKKYSQYITDINHQWYYYPGNGINGILTITYRFR